jgi:hypothetical protein
MTHLVKIESAQVVDGDALLAAFAAQGITGELVDREPRLVFRLGDAGRDAKRFALDVGRALDGWVAEQRVALIPMSLGDDAFVLRPPAA